MKYLLVIFIHGEREKMTRKAADRTRGKEGLGNGERTRCFRTVAEKERKRRAQEKKDRRFSGIAKKRRGCWTDFYRLLVKTNREMK